MRKQITMALTGISICLAMNNTANGQELFLDGGTGGIGSTTTSPNPNVGIGFTDPTHKLVVSDNITSGGLMKLVSSNGQPNDKWWIGFCHGTNTSDYYDRARIGVDILAGGYGRLFFSTGLQGNVVERMRIDENGRFGIGNGVNAVPNVDYKLKVSADNGEQQGIHSVVNNTGHISNYGIGLHGEATYNVNNTGVQGVAFGGGTDVGMYGSAQNASTRAIGGQFKGRFAPVNEGINVEAQASTSTGTYAYAGKFNANSAQYTYGLDVTASNTSTSISASNHGINIYADAHRGLNYGIKLTAEHAGSALNMSNYGIHTEAKSSNNNTTNYGIYATINSSGATTPPFPPGANATGSFAGYFWGGNASGPGIYNAAFFNGLVTQTAGTTTVSDKKFKDNIEEVAQALEKISKLKPASYTYFGPDKFPSFSFPKGNQYGFIAQELEQVIPELVVEGVNPAQYDSKGNKIDDAVSFKSVNYTALIPILTAGIQEQQAIIETQNAKIAELEERLAKLEKGGTTGIGSTGTTTINGAALYQNTPNPFNSHTEIGYKLPQQYSEAKIMVFDMNGRQVRTVALTGEAEGKVSFYPNELAAGMYMYSLVIDGQEIDTKRMILSGR